VRRSDGKTIIVKEKNCALSYFYLESPAQSRRALVQNFGARVQNFRVEAQSNRTPLQKLDRRTPDCRGAAA
jgi:hypothetical protein